MCSEHWDFLPSPPPSLVVQYASGIGELEWSRCLWLEKTRLATAAIWFHLLGQLDVTKRIRTGRSK